MKNKVVKIMPLGVKAEKITSLLGMVRGFMFSRRAKTAKLFVMPHEMFVDIHMFFVFFPLIIAWTDKNKRIRHFSRALPFVFYKIHRAKYVLEVPYNNKVFRKLKKGMKLSWN